MKSFNNFSSFCENKNYSHMFLNVLKNAADRGLSSTRFVDKILEPCYYQEWETHLDFIRWLTCPVCNESFQAKDCDKKTVKFIKWVYTGPCPKCSRASGGFRVSPSIGRQLHGGS